MNGKVVPNPGAIPKNTLPRFVVALRPVGSASGEDWTPGKYVELEFVADILNCPEANCEVILRENTHPAGTYDARLYFQIWDLFRSNSKSVTEYLAKSTITITDSE
jgi:hypothetical protein